jgi:hypothetical protein
MLGRDLNEQLAIVGKVFCKLGRYSLRWSIIWRCEDFRWANPCYLFSILFLRMHGVAAIFYTCRFVRQIRPVHRRPPLDRNLHFKRRPLAGVLGCGEWRSVPLSNAIMDGDGDKEMPRDLVAFPSCLSSSLRSPVLRLTSPGYINQSVIFFIVENALFLS